MSQTKSGEWTLYDPENNNAKHFEDRSTAEGRKEDMQNLGVDVDLYPPGESPDGVDSDDTDDTAEDDSSESLEGACADNTIPCAECGESVEPNAAEFGPKNEPYHVECWAGEDEEHAAECGICGEPVDISEARSGAGGQPIHGDCYAEDDEPVETEVIETDAVEADNPEPVETPDLPEKTLSEDPLNWVPGHFVDEIEGVPTINRKGYAVIAEHYDISVTAEVVTSPAETDFEYAEFQATAETPDGATYSGWGSAHIDRGDDKEILAEMAETRAMKRATAWATGVGMTAMEELRGEVDGDA
jgi:hypothetical protein